MLRERALGAPRHGGGRHQWPGNANGSRLVPIIAQRSCERARFRWAWHPLAGGPVYWVRGGKSIAIRLAGYYWAGPGCGSQCAHIGPISWRAPTSLRAPAGLFVSAAAHCVSLRAPDIATVQLLSPARASPFICHKARGPAGAPPPSGDIIGRFRPAGRPAPGPWPLASGLWPLAHGQWPLGARVD